MNTLLLNRDTFQMPTDGWYQIAPLGEFPHSAGGVVQIVDREACAAMANRFAEEAKTVNFAGLLVDFDHFSLDGEKRSEAAGWIVALEARPQLAVGSEQSAVGNSSAGLWAKIRWSDLGEEAVKGGRYRFLSPVWARSDCLDLGNGKLRPVRLLNAAVTNDPNLKGMVPLSNRTTGPQDHGTTGPAPGTGKPREPAAGGQRGVPRFKWVLGDSPEGRHCPSCAAMAGQVHTMEQWKGAGVGPGCGGLYCQGNCHCSLVETEDAESGEIGSGPMRKPNPPPLRNYGGTPGAAPDGAAWSGRLLRNVGWTDEARAAALAVRQAKAGARSAGSGQARGWSAERPPAVPGRPLPTMPPWPTTPPWRPPKPGEMYLGGTPYFDEKTGTWIGPKEGQPVDFPIDPGRPHILPYPYPEPTSRRMVYALPKEMASAPGGRAGGIWPLRGGDEITWSPSARVQADKARVRAARSGTSGQARGARR